MIRDICKDEFFLSQKAEPAMTDDLAIARDLLDTLTAHKDGCVGMRISLSHRRLSCIDIEINVMNDKFVPVV